MTETSHSSNPRQAQAEAPGRLSADLLNIIVAFLIPMFLGGSAGDVAMARLAAIETVCAYGVCSYRELLTVVQLIAFSLATLDSLSLSMEDDLSLSMILRLRGNANALHRAGERHRCTLDASRKDHESHQPQDAAIARPIPASAFQSTNRPVEERSPPKAQPQAAPSPVPSPPAAPQSPHPSAGPMVSGMAAQQGEPPLSCHLAPPRPVGLRAALGSSATHLLSAAPPSPFVHDAGVSST